MSHYADTLVQNKRLKPHVCCAPIEGNKTVSTFRSAPKIAAGMASWKSCHVSSFTWAMRRRAYRSDRNAGDWWFLDHGSVDVRKNAESSVTDEVNPLLFRSKNDSVFEACQIHTDLILLTFDNYWRAYWHTGCQTAVWTGETFGDVPISVIPVHCLHVLFQTCQKPIPQEKVHQTKAQLQIRHDWFPSGNQTWQ